MPVSQQTKTQPCSSILRPDIANQFANERNITAFNPEGRVCMAWYLYPAKVGQHTVWLLIDAAFGYVVLVDAEPVTADQIDLAGVETIDYLLPEDREEDNVSVSLDPSDVSWHESVVG